MMNLETFLEKLAQGTLIVAGLLGLACAFAQFEHYISKQLEGLEKSPRETVRSTQGLRDDDSQFGLTATKTQGRKNGNR